MEEAAATASTDWIGLGDRSHPNLELVDKLKRELTYDGHENDLRELEQAHFEGFPEFTVILNRVKGLEKMNRGDRSHPNLVRLDELMNNLTYHGWRDDVQEAEKEHQSNNIIFDVKIKLIERKQKIHVGDRSDEDLKFLDSLRLSYPGWETHRQRLVGLYIKGFDLTDDEKFCLSERQRMYEGDRSHPRLAALDSLRLTYPGCEKDIEDYEFKHVGAFSYCEGRLDDSAEYLAIFKRKQQDYATGRVDLSWMHPIQRTIVETQWTFPGWKHEVQQVRGSTSDFSHVLEDFQLKQMIHDEDYSRHPMLIKLKSMQLSYPGWEKDMKDCRRQLTSYLGRYLFESSVEGMLTKQHVYNGYLRSMIRDTKEEKQVKSMGECIVCWEAPRTQVFVPCGHMCACKSCSTRVMENRKVCPTCNQPSTMAIEVFMP